jgi:hypothetical protein
MENQLVKIVIPVYKKDLNKDESLALAQCCKILSRYPLVIVKPRSLDVNAILQKYPQLETESFDDDSFKNLEAYNTLMLSPLFYKRFLDYEYILVYQLDAYVFKDELEDWCCKSYDYIGAPWIVKGLFWKKMKRLFKKLTGRKEKRPYRDCFFKVGNGGFSLRRTNTFYEIASETAICSEFVPEDILWSRRLRSGNYRVPDYKEALLFSFDKYPAEGFRITRKIPFGCHAWNRKKMFHFWKDFILR